MEVATAGTLAGAALKAAALKNMGNCPLGVVASLGNIVAYGDGINCCCGGWVTVLGQHMGCHWDFNQLLQQPSVQQLPLANPLELLLQAVRSSCREGLQCLLEGLPAAQEGTEEGLQLLLGEAVRGAHCEN